MICVLQTFYSARLIICIPLSPLLFTYINTYIHIYTHDTYICAYTTFICVCVYIYIYSIFRCNTVPFLLHSIHWSNHKFMFRLKEWGNCFWNVVCIKIVFSWTFFLIAWSLLCCSWALSSHREWGRSSLWGAGFSLRRLLLLKSMGSRAWVSGVVVHGLNCPTARRIFLGQGSKLCPRTGWQTSMLCATREVLLEPFKSEFHVSWSLFPK